MSKSLAAFAISSLITLAGILLRMNAQAMAWPDRWSFSGARADTNWAHQELAIGEVGLVLLCMGGLMFVATFAHWLFAADKKGIDQPETPQPN